VSSVWITREASTRRFISLLRPVENGGAGRPNLVALVW
jgi:hypothetical protein